MAGRNHESHFLTDFVLGGVSGAVAKTCTAPIERVKLVLQTQDAHPLVRSGAVPRYNGIANCFRRVLQEQGLQSFWRGNFTNVIRYYPAVAFNFAFKDRLKGVFPRAHPKDGFSLFVLTNLASGTLAVGGSLCVVYPLDYARTRLASDVGPGKREFTGLVDCLWKTTRRSPLAVYTGFGVALFGIVPHRGTFFGLYDSLREKNPFRHERGMLGVASRFAVAQLTGLAMGYASYPFDTVRRRLQMQANRPREEWVYRGIVDCFGKVLREGPTAFFKGAGANALRTVGSALVLVLYDEFRLTDLGNPF